MVTGTLYEPQQFEPLIDEPWVPARVEDAIAAIVADADAAFDPTALWPAHEWDALEKPLPLSGLYVGAAGVIWALDELQRRGHAESSHDLAGMVMHAVELERATPDFSADGHYRPGALMSGETGALLIAFRLTSDRALTDDLCALVRGNVDHPTDDICWGAPGTLLAALAMSEWTGEARWDEVARESAVALRERRGDDGLWRQDDAYRGFSTLHGVAGNTLALLRFEGDAAVASESAAVLSRHAFCEDGLANWPGSPRPQLRRPRDGRICLQWCTGAPSSSGKPAHIRTRRATGYATARRATASHSSRRSHAQVTSAGSSGRAASQSTPSPKQSGSQQRTAGAATRSSTATSAPRCSPQPASTPTPDSRSSTSSSRPENPQTNRDKTASHGDPMRDLARASVLSPDLLFCS